MADEAEMGADFEVDDAALSAAEKVYESVCQPFPSSVGSRLSSAERQRRALSDPGLTYGESAFAPIAIALQKIERLYGGLAEPGGLFVDLGCGVGKALVAAAACRAWEECIGLETLRDLVDAAQALCSRYAAQRAGAAGCAKGVAVARADIGAVDWSAADCVFINATCFSNALMEKLALVADRMASGSWAVTITRRLPSAEWAVLEHQTFSMNDGGAATFYIHRKISPRPPHAYFYGVSGGLTPLREALEKAPAAGGAAKPPQEPEKKSGLAHMFGTKKIEERALATRDPMAIVMGPGYVDGEKALNFNVASTDR
jgi:SAM-dependent methyltransferase